MKEKFSLKDELFNPQKVEKIALEIKAVYPSFNETSFIKDTLFKFQNLELKERIYHIRDMLSKYLPRNYQDAVNLLLDALPPPLDTAKVDNDFGDFIYAPYSDFVAFHGCCAKYLDFSLEALRHITKRFSVEFSIRDFINLYPKETLKMLYHCSLSPNYHERRLASEGLRPTLPWAKKLIIAYHEPLRHLENLFTDPTPYVIRSVANHLNDISKFDAPLVIQTLKRWKSLKKQKAKEMDYIMNHALRMLVKKGNKEALELLGYIQNPAITLSNFSIEHTELKIEDALYFSFTLKAQETVKLMIDYSLHFQTKSGTLSPKVHKLKKLLLKKGEEITLKKKHPFKANMTTRTFYTGEHKVQLQINGQKLLSKIFMLKVNQA